VWQQPQVGVAGNCTNSHWHLIPATLVNAGRIPENRPEKLATKNATSRTKRALITKTSCFANFFIFVFIIILSGLIFGEVISVSEQNTAAKNSWKICPYWMTYT
jgi:hypothetical protein